MSDRSRVSQIDPNRLGQSAEPNLDPAAELNTDLKAANLNGHHADQHTAALDLSAASIPQTEVQRLAAVRDRRIRPNPAIPGGPIVSPGLERALNSGKSNGKSSTPPGVFKNPPYPYRGGVVNRVITFLANVLKLLERILLSSLSRRHQPAPAKPVQAMTPSQNGTRAGANSGDPAKTSEEKRKEREAIENGKNVIRSMD